MPMTMPTTMMRPAHRLLLASCLTFSVAAGGCAEDFPADHDRSYGDFGTEAYQMLHDEYLWSGTAAEGALRAQVFESRRGELIAALNALVEAPVDPELLPLLERMLPLYDDTADGSPGALPAMTRDTADILDTFVTDPRNLEAIAQVDAAMAANPLAVEGMLGALARHPLAVIDRAIDLTLEMEPQLTDLFRYLHRELPGLDDAYIISSTQKSLLQRLLEVNIETTGEALGPLVLSARMDGRGAPMVQQVAGQFPAPFVDADGDGVVDVDDFGRPVDSLGVPIHLPTLAQRSTLGEERDAQGRAILGGHLVYDYFNLRTTALAFILRDGRTLIERGFHLDLFTAFEGLLGERVPRTDVDGLYDAYDADTAPLLDLLHVVNELRRYPRIVPLIRALEHAVVVKEPLLRQLVVSVAQVRRIFEGAPSLKPGNTLFDDLHDTLVHMVQHGVLRHMIAVSDEPATQAMFDGLATQMSFTNMAFPDDMATLTRPEEVDVLAFREPTPWAAPDVDDSQRSWLQKSALLMWDTRAAPVYLKLFDEEVIYDIQITDNMANLYVDAIGGSAALHFDNELLETLTVDLVDEFDDLTPSARQLNLFMNHDQAATGNPECNQGLQVRNHYGRALLSLQASGSLDAMGPWVEGIVARGRQGDFVDLFATLAQHYSETAYDHGDFRSHGTGFRKLESYLVRALTETDLPDQYLALMAWADTATLTVEGKQINVADELDIFLRWMLDPTDTVRLRDGSTGLTQANGLTIETPTRLQLLLDAFDRIDRSLDEAPLARQAWDRIDLMGVFLDLDASGELANQHALDVIVALIPIFADEVVQAVAEPDWQASIDTFMEDVLNIFGGRGLPAVVDLMGRVRDTPRHVAFVDELLAAMLAEHPPADDADLFGAQLRVLSLLAQLRVPVDATTQFLRFAGEVLDPEARRVFTAMETLKALRDLDPAGALDALARNLFEEFEVNGQLPYTVIKDTIKQAARLDPGGYGPFSADDFGEIMGDVRDWLRDADKGAERLYDVIRNR